jgi:hypothetical protein
MAPGKFNVMVVIVPCPVRGVRWLDATGGLRVSESQE